MAIHIRRREFVVALGGAAASWPLAVRAQQSAMPVIGFLNGQSAQAYAPAVASFRRGLNEAGYVEGQNVAIEYRWAEGRVDRLPPLAADLVGRRVAVIAATGGNNSALVAMQATSTIPIVFTSSDNPIERGLVASINRPGGNVTGVSWFNAELGPKRLGLLHELVPDATIVALLINPNNPESVRQPAELQDAARAIGLQLVLLTATTKGAPRSRQWWKIASAHSSSAAIRSLRIGANKSSGWQRTMQFRPFMPKAVVTWL
jgi:putative ABC transport system substrate-binding protein